MKPVRLLLLAVVLLALSLLPVPSSTGAPPAPDVAAPVSKRLRLPVVANRVLHAMAQLGQTNLEYGLELDWGGDVDTEVVLVGTPPKPARRTGNGAALPSPDGNTIPDHYMQFRVADGILFSGSPTGRVRIEGNTLTRAPTCSGCSTTVRAAAHSEMGCSCPQAW